MSLRTRWKALSQNPIYLREAGHWGEPNPFYERLSRYAPFIVMGALVLGGCAGFSDIPFMTNNNNLSLVWCLVCLPAFLLTILTWFGVLMAPALTAPSVSMEKDKGSWDLLRLTPYPTHTILLAKLLGGLTRLRIWRLLFALTALEGAILICGTSFTLGNYIVWGWLSGMMIMVRPWAEILFAALMGMYASTWVRSATMALAASYTGVIVFKLFNSSLLWMGALSLLRANDDIFNLAWLGSNIGQTAVYLLANAGLWWGITQRAPKVTDL